MGEEVYARSEEARRNFYIASDLTGVDLAEVCFGSQTERLDETLVAQPAIAAVTISDAAYLKSLGIRFDAGIGHSLGEVPLLAMAGILSVKDTFNLIQARASATAKASKTNPGRMGAISGLTKEQIESKASHVLGGARVALANLNGTRQQVFSGDHEPMQELEKLVKNLQLKERLRVRYTHLKTGGAFHSPFHMREAVGEFYDAASGLEYKTPEFELMLNNSSYLSELGVSNLAEYLSRQLISPVDFVSAPGRLIEDEVSNFIEVGPLAPGAKYKTLSGLLSREFAGRVKIIEVSELGNGSKGSSAKVD